MPDNYKLKKLLRKLKSWIPDGADPGRELYWYFGALALGIGVLCVLFYLSQAP